MRNYELCMHAICDTRSYVDSNDIRTSMRVCINIRVLTINSDYFNSIEFHISRAKCLIFCDDIKWHQCFRVGWIRSNDAQPMWGWCLLVGGNTGTQTGGGFNHVDILWIQKDTNSDERFPLDGAREGRALRMRWDSITFRWQWLRHWIILDNQRNSSLSFIVSTERDELVWMRIK